VSLDGLVALLYLAVGYPFLVVGVVFVCLVAYFVIERFFGVSIPRASRSRSA
jgi:hypothetical protein